MLDQLLYETLGKERAGREIPLKNMCTSVNGWELTRWGLVERAIEQYHNGTGSAFAVGRAIVEVRRAYKTALAIDPESAHTKDLYEGVQLACKSARIALHKSP